MFVRNMMPMSPPDVELDKCIICGEPVESVCYNCKEPVCHNNECSKSTYIPGLGDHPCCLDCRGDD